MERQHPYSEWSRRSILMQAYAYYEGNQYADAVAASERFIQLYPGSPSAASTTPGRQSIAGIPPLACRPPWFEQ